MCTLKISVNKNQETEWTLLLQAGAGLGGENSWQMFPGGSGGGLEPGGWAVRERECPLGLERRHGQTAGSFHYCGAFEGRFTWLRSSLVAQKVKNPPANAEDIRDRGSIPGLGRSLGGGHGNPLQNSCLGNLMDRGAWRATVRGVTKSQAWLNDETMTNHLI